ncbi:glycosyltransferase family 9 protein [Glaciimonas sp. GG7]
MALTSSHILICRTDNIGDVILTLPIAARIKQQYPSIKISFLCRAYAASVVRHCSSVDEVIEVEDILSDAAAYFAQSDIDTIIFSQPDQHLARAAFKARIPNRIGNSRHKLYQLLYCNRRVRFKKGNSEHHEAQFNFEFLRPFGLNDIPEITEIPALYSFNIPENIEIKQLLAQYPFNIILHTKSNGHGREWPIAHYLTLARQLSKDKNIQLWLTGSAAEGQWLAENAVELLALPNVSNVCGRFTLDELTTFIKAADGLIASGTGPLHISAAIGQRTLGLFPPIRPMHPGRWAPVGTQAQTLCIPSNCSGCKDAEAENCACMKNIAPATVEKIVLQWYKEAAPVVL